MTTTLKFLALIITLVNVSPVFAAAPSDVLAGCLVDNLNGKERKNLAKWIFFSIAAHPDIKSYSNVSPEDIKESDKYVGKLITRLLADNCQNQLKGANSSDPLAVQKAFEIVGKVAMQELMANEDVIKTISNYAQYADMARINKILNAK